MGLLRTLKSKLVATRAALSLNAPDGAPGWNIVRGDAPTQYQSNGKTVRIEGWERHPVVMACTRLVSELVASVPFEVYTVDKDGVETVVPGHQLGKLLNEPFNNMSGFRFRLLLALHYLLYGNTFWLLDRGNIDLQAAGPIPPSTAPIQAIRMIHPEQIQFCYTDAIDHEPLLWDWRDRNGVMHRSSAQDIVHVADMTGSDWIFGYPRAAAALKDISTDNEASDYVRLIVKNDGAPTLVMIMDQELGAITREELDAARDRWHEQQRGRGQLGRARFLASVKDVKQLGFNLKDLEFPALRAIAREDICAVFGIDPRMVGIASAKGAEGGLSGKQYFEARFRLIQQTVIPLMRAIESQINLWVSPEFGNVYARFSQQGLNDLTEDEAETWDRGQKAMTAGGITIEEFRDMIGFDEKLPNDEHVIVALTGQIVPAGHLDQIADAKLKAVLTAPEPLGLPNGPQGGQSVPAGGGQKAPKQLPAGNRTSNDRPATTRARSPHPLLVTRHTALVPSVRAAAWSHLDTTAKRLEPKYTRAAQLRFRHEAQSVAAIFHSYSERARQGPVVRDVLHPDPYIQEAQRRILNNYRGRGEYYKGWVSAYTTLTNETVGIAGNEMSAALGVDFNLHDPQIEQITSQRVTQLADYVTETTAESIKAAVDVGIAEGMGMQEIADLIQASVFGDMSDARATMIARTETIGALNESAYTTAQLSDAVQEKEWLTQGDDRVRESHAEIDGEVVGIDELFSNGLEFPGDQNGDAEDVINCRCGMLFHTTDPEGNEDTYGDDSGEE